MDFKEKNKLAENLGKCLSIIPNDKYIKDLYEKTIKECNFYDGIEDVYTNRHYGKLKDFITRIIDFDKRNYKSEQLREFYPSFEFHYYFIEQMPKDLLSKRLYLYKKFMWHDNNPLFLVAKEIINNEIKKFYNENKIQLHVKK